MSKNKDELERDMAALNMVFRDYEKYIGTEVRFYIDIMKIDGIENVIVWDSKLNRVAHEFGTTEYYSKLMTKYAVLPSMFDEMSA